MTGKYRGNRFVRSAGFIKKLVPLLLFPAMYMMTDIIMSVSADRMVRCFMSTECIRLQRHLTAKTTGTYYVYVENIEIQRKSVQQAILLDSMVLRYRRITLYIAE